MTASTLIGDQRLVKTKDSFLRNQEILHQICDNVELIAYLLVLVLDDKHLQVSNRQEIRKFCTLE